MGRAFKTLSKQAFCSLSPDGERAGDRGEKSPT